jgi:hypothetical protein
MGEIDATTPKSYNNNVITTVFRVLYHPEARPNLIAYRLQNESRCSMLSTSWPHLDPACATPTKARSAAAMVFGSFVRVRAGAPGEPSTGREGAQGEA